MGPDSVVETYESEINGLFLMALDRIAFLPYGLIVDKWRWQAFNGTINQNEWNAKWWELRRDYQQIVPPITRGEEHFDPGATYQVTSNVPYIG